MYRSIFWNCLSLVKPRDAIVLYSYLMVNRDFHKMTEKGLFDEIIFETFKNMAVIIKCRISKV